MDPLVARWCQRHLGSAPVADLLRSGRMSAVRGLRLADGREVVVKVRPAQARLAACAAVQGAVRAAGLACPALLAGPLPLAEGPHPVWVAGDQGEPVDARGLAVSAETWEGQGWQGAGDLGPDGYARLLARIVAAAPPVAALPTLEPAVPWLWWDHPDPARTWPPPASQRWDPHRVIASMPGLVPEVARRARARLLRADVATLPLVAGHGDFEPQNCRWVPGPHGDRLVVHDWDSVVARPEAVLAGNAAATYWPDPDHPRVPVLAEHEGYMDAYADQRGRSWTALECEVGHATAAWVLAYIAAFEHLKDGPGPATAHLLGLGRDRLERAGA